MTDLGDLDAVATADAVRSGEVGAREVVAAAIARVEATDPRYGFLVAERFEQALAEAERVDRAAPLAGVPILVKDCSVTVAGLPLTDGSVFARGWVAPRDSPYVARLRRAGGIVLGSATTAEMAENSACETLRYGVTRNPAAPGRTTGGSSGGSAAAVAAGAVPAAHGSDAGGSIRNPAACCGLVGLKPTRGRNLRGPVPGDADADLWVEHPIVRTVRDCAAFLDAAGGAAPDDPHAPPPPARPFLEAASADPRPMRVAVATCLPDGRPLQPDSARAVELTAARLERLGHELVEGGPRFDVAAADDDYFTVFAAGVAGRIDRWAERLGRGPAGDDLDPLTWHLLGRARTRAAELPSAVERLREQARRILAFFEDVDLWLSPTSGTPPFPLGYLRPGPDLDVEEAIARDAIFTAFTWPFNLTGQPALSYPAHRTADGVPIGVQLAARFGDEDALLGVAGSLERHA